MMWFTNPVWAAMGLLLLGARAQDDNAGCSCSGLDYADGGSYLVDGNSENDFTFYSVFQGTRAPFRAPAHIANENRLLQLYHHPDPCLANWRWLRMLSHRFST